MRNVTNKTLELFKLLVVWNIAFCTWLQPLASWNLIPFYLPKREDRGDGGLLYNRKLEMATLVPFLSHESSSTFTYLTK